MSKWVIVDELPDGEVKDKLIKIFDEAFSEDRGMSGDVMNFPNTWEEYEEQYGFNDTEQVYTNGSRLIQSFRVKQWLEHIEVGEGNQVLYGNEHNCILTMFGECSYNETGCGSCAVAEKIRKALSVEVSEDAVSRTKLKQDLEAWAVNLGNPKTLVRDDVFVVIDTAPSVIPKPKEGEWIPCSERLPESRGYYICTCKDGSKYKRASAVKWSNGWQLTGARAYWIVLAWMPLPKPWKGASDER